VLTNAHILTTIKKKRLFPQYKSPSQHELSHLAVNSEDEMDVLIGVEAFLDSGDALFHPVAASQLVLNALGHTRVTQRGIELVGFPHQLAQRLAGVDLNITTKIDN
jgi:hypothetical protein